MELCRNEFETVDSIKEATAICSHVTLDVEALCFAAVKGAKVTYIQTVKEAKTTCTCTTQEAEATCSVAIRDAETQEASQAMSLHRQHGKAIPDLGEQSSKRKAEAKLTSSLPVRLPYTPAQPSSKACW